MREKYIFYIIGILIWGTIISCEKENKPTIEENIVYYSNLGTFVDNRDSMEYKWVEIGGQTWMAENLRYQAGKNYSDSLDSLHYGVLYSQGGAKCCACPDGWRLPTYDDWNQLREYLGGKSVAGAHLKDTSSLWDSPNKGATNYTKFNAIPGGYIEVDRDPDVSPVIRRIGKGAYFWYNSNQYNVHYSYARVDFDSERFLISSGQDISDDYYFHIRCIKE